MADELDQDELQRRALQGEILGLPPNIAQQTLGIPPASLAGRAMVRGIMQPQPIPKAAPEHPLTVNPDVAPPPLNFPPQPPSAATIDPVVMPAGGAPKQSAWLEGQKPGWQQIHNPFLRGLAGVGSTIADIAAPGLSSRIPGTGMHHDFLVHQALGREAAQGQEAEREAQTQETQARTQEAQARVPLIQAQTKKTLEQPTDKGDQLRNAYDEAVLDAIQHNQDPSQSPKVQQLSDALTSLQKQPALAAGQTPLTKEQADRLNATWNNAAKAAKLPENQFNEHMTHAEAGDLIKSLNEASGRQQGQQRIGLTINSQGNVEAGRERKWAMWTDPVSGKPVAGPVSQGTASGATDMAELQGTEVKDLLNARHTYTILTKRGDPDKPETQGVIQLIDSLEKDGKLGLLASRWNRFSAQGIGADPGDDPRIITLIDKNMLGDTGAMLTHFGASGGRSPQMLQHFIDLANSAKMDGPTLKAGTLAIADYMADRGMLPQSAGKAAPPATQPAAPQGKWNAKTGRYE